MNSEASALRYSRLPMSRRSLRHVGTNVPVGGHDFSRAVKDDKQRGFSPLRYLRSPGSARFRSSWEGTTSVVPLITNKQRGFSPCGTGRSRCLAVLWDTWGPLFPVGGHDFSRAVKDDKQRGFSPLLYLRSSGSARFRSSWEGTTLVVPLSTDKQRGFSPCGTCGLKGRAQLSPRWEGTTSFVCR